MPTKCRTFLHRLKTLHNASHAAGHGSRTLLSPSRSNLVHKSFTVPQIVTLNDFSYLHVGTFDAALFCKRRISVVINRLMPGGLMFAVILVRPANSSCMGSYKSLSMARKMLKYYQRTSIGNNYQVIKIA